MLLVTLKNNLIKATCIEQNSRTDEQIKNKWGEILFYQSCIIDMSLLFKMLFD